MSSVPNALLPEPPFSTRNSVTDAVVSRHKPTLNSGRIDGTLRVLLPESFTLNGNTQITSDLFLPGSPNITTGGGSQYSGTVNDGGSAAPTDYTLTLSGGISLPGKIHTQVDAIQLPDFPNSVPAASGTRTVTVNSQSATANIGNWQTVRDLNVTGAHITIDVPPGNYGTFTVNGNSQLRFSAGTYNFANTFNLDGSATVQTTGLVTINVGQNLIINSGAVVLGSYTSPGDLNVNVLGATVSINGSSQVTGLLHAYNANATVSGTAQVRGQVIANALTLNGSGKVIGAVWPANSAACPTIFGPRRFDRTTGPSNQYVEQFSLPSGFTSPFTLHIQNGAPDGTQRVSSATVRLNGVDVLSPSDLNQNVASVDRSVNLATNNQLYVRVTSDPGSYLIINLCGTVPTSDTTAPVLAITSPQNNFTTSDSAITISGTATDNGAGATGVAHVYVNDVEASYNSAAGTWTITNFALDLGDNQIVVRAVDQAGNQSTASIKVTRQSPVNNAPTADAGPDQTLALPNTATLHGTASDDGQPAGSTLTTTWSKVSGPGTVTFGDAAALNTTASFSESGSYVLLLTASDGVLSKTDDVTITVQPQNQPPTVSAGPDQMIALPHTATLNGTVTDDGLPAGNTVTTEWSKVSGPGTVTFEDATLTDTNATFSESGPYVLRLTASDGDLSAKSDVRITVQPENHAPTVSAGQSQTVSLPDGTAQLNGSATDDGLPFGSSLTVSWGMQIGPAAPIFDNPNSATTTVHFTVAGTYALRLTATDGELTSSADVNITVTPPNQAPSVNAGSDQSIALPNVANLSGTVNDDGLPLGGSVSTLWSVVSGPGTVTFANPSVTVTTASFSAAGTYVLRLTASDSQLASSGDVTITVNLANQAPLVNAGPDQSISSCTANLQGTASDDGQPVGSSLTISWTKVSGPGNVTFTNPAGLSTSASFSAAGNYVLRLTASDSDYETSDDLTVAVGVTASNTAPRYFGPTPYLSFQDSPFRNGTFSYFYLEDFEDHLLNTPGVTAEAGGVTGVIFGPGFHDSVDGDDGAIDGHGGTGDSFFNGNGAQGVKFTFNPSVLGSLPTYAGAVWTDGAGTVSFEAFDRNGVSMGLQGPFNLADGVFADTVAEDRFFGAYNPNGISAIRVTNTSGGIEVDHLQYGFGNINGAPMVDAGPDQTIMAPATTASLNGSVTDDGLPACGVLTVSWSQVSGPGTASFANANSASTTATFPALGVYVLRLTANDSAVTSTDDVTINVTTNQAPVADFGLAANKGPVPLTTVSFSSYRNDGFETYHPKQLLDSTVNTYWWSGDGQVSNQSIVFATADGRAALIDRVRLQNPFTDGTDVRQFEVQVSSATANASDFHSVLIASMPDNPTPMEFVFPAGPVTARFIKLVVISNYGSSVSTILGTFQPVSFGGFDSIVSFLGKPNSALNQSPALIQNGGAIYDFSYGGGTTTADGMLGYGRGGWVASSTTNQFAIIQLGGNKLHTIDGIKIATWYDFGYGRSTAVQDFEVWASSTTTDAAAFTRVLAASVVFNPQVQTFMFPGGPVQARYVKYVPLNNVGGGAQINTAMFDVIAEGTARVVGSSGQDTSQTNPPEQAFDDAYTTLWFSPSGAVSDVWVKTSLEDETIHKVRGVRINPVNDFSFGLHGPKDFDIRVSTTTTDDSAFATVYSGTLSSTIINTATYQEFIFPTPVDAKYVEFYWKNGYSTSNIGVRDLVVLADSTKGSTLIDYSSSNDPLSYGPENALDLDTLSPWRTGNSQTTNQWLKLSLPGNDLYTIDHVALMPGSVACGFSCSDFNVSPKDFEVQVSTTDANDSSFVTAFAGTLNKTNLLQHFSFAPVQARYVRLLLKNNYGSSLIALNSFHVYTSDHAGSDPGFIDQSTDSDGHVVAWSWNFGDGGTSNQQNPSHHYAAAGTYTVTLTVTDDAGLTATHQLNLKVGSTSGAPSFAISPMFANEGAQFVRFTDTSTLMMQSFGHRVFDFGNGGSVLDLQQATYYPYQFADSGSFNVTMTLGENNSLKAIVTQPMTVRNLPPSVAVQPGKTVLWGESWTNAPTISDPSSIDNQSLHGVWDFGDGQTSACNNCTNTSATVTHAYTLPGSYNATLTVTDKDGGAANATAVYTVNRRPTALVFQAPPNQSSGAGLLITATLTDTFGNVPLANKPVQLKLNGASLNTVTGADGVASVSVPLPAGTKIDILTGTFSGDSLYLACGGVGVPNTAGGRAPNGTPGNSGTNFWLMFPQSYQGSQYLFISAPQTTTGTVSIPFSNFTQNFTVPANDVVKIQLPFAETTESDVVTQHGIHVTSQLPIMVYGMNQHPFTSDAFLGLPVDALGKDHYVLTYSNMSFAPSSELGVVASENGTTVTVTPSANTGNRLAGVPYSVVLNQGQTYLLQNTVPTTAGDLTGSRVTGDKPIAVFGAHEAATIPAEVGCCADHMVEQLPPTSAWGKRFATIPLATRIKGDFFRIIAAEDNTEVYLNSTLTATLNHGEWVERIVLNPAEIIATKPIMVAQLSTSIFYDAPPSNAADPFMMIIPPYSQFLDHYTVSTPPAGFPINYANVVAPTDWLGEITMDGEPIPDWMFTDIGVSGYSGAQVPISVGAHTFYAPVSFGVFIYGYSTDEGYGYPGGMNLKPASQNINVAVSPETLVRPINGQACLVATVTDQEQSPLGGRTVNFAATGANTANTSATTNGAGQAQFCYTGTDQGTDQVRASVDSFSATASVQWLTDVPNQAPVVNAGADQTINLPAPAGLQGSATDDGLPSNTLNVTWSRVSGPGTVTFASPSSLFTSATFSTTGVYVLRLSATDLSLTSSDDVQITVNPVPTNHSPTANAGPDQSAAIKGNLIVNPGNDLPLVNGQIPGWIEVQGTSWTKGNSSIPGLPDPQRGNSFFWVGTDGGYAELRQDIDVSAYAASIANGTQQFELQAYIRQVIECFIPDVPQVVLEYRNAQNDGIIGSLQSYSGYAPSWALIQGVNTVPPGTGWIRVRLIAQNNCGPIADAYFDSISLRPVGNTAVKLNGAVNDDGLPFGSSVSAHWTAVSGPAPVTFSNANVANSGALFTTPGTYVLRLTSTDGQLSASDDVTVTVSPQNQAPVVGGATQQTITLPGTASVTATVSDDGLPVGSSVSVQWKKDQGPGIVTFSNPNANATTASFSTPGFYVLSFTADDSEYASTTYFYVSVNSATSNSAPVVDAGPDRTITLPTNSTTLNGNVADDGLPTGSPLQVQWTQVSGPALATFANAGSAVTSVQLSTVGTYVLRLNASDGQLSASDDVSVTVIAQNQRPTVSAGPDAQTILSQPVQLNGSASDDGLPVGNTVTTNWTEFSGPGTVTFGNIHAPVTGAQFSAVGTYVLRLTVNDGQLSASDDVTITVNQDVPAPTVQITAPADDASVTDPTPVTGSVSGGDWKLEYSMDSTDDASTRVWTAFASGSGAASGTLGNIDPTMMLNGLFDIRLSSTDQYGQTSRTKVSVIVERNLKIGNFTVSFTDLSIPVAGVPMEVTRTYDSRDKRVGDFGFGWTMGLQNIRVDKSSVVGLKWYETVTQEVFPNYCLQAIGSHTVTVTFPGGKVFKFQPQVAPQCQRNAPITAGTLSFTPMPGTVGKLEVVGNTDVQIDGSVPGPVNLIGFGSGVDIFNSFIFKFTAQDGTAYIIDQRTGLQSIADTSGNTLTISGNGIVHSSGKSIVFHRDIAGRIESIDDPNGNSMFYEYDEHGDLISFTDNEHNKSTYTYDSNHRLLTIKDPRNIQPMRNDYDPVTGRLISHTDAFGKQITYLHDVPNRTETVTDRLNHSTVFIYDERGNVLTKTDARGGVTTFTYDANDNVLTEENALHQTTVYTYDENNNRTSIKDPLNNLTLFTYNALGKVLTAEDPLHHVTTNTYDSAGRLKTTEDPLHNVTSYIYSVVSGQLISMTDASHQTTRYEYTGNYLTKLTDALGRETTFTYDNNGNRKSQTVKRTNALGQIETITTNYEYDKLNRLTKTIFADGSFTKVEYNSIGQQAATVDQLSHRTEFTYDDMGRLTKTTYADTTFEETTYDAEGRPLTSKDRAGHLTTCDYDELGRLTKTTFIDGTFTQTSYDAIGQVKTTTDARNNVTHYFYDDGGRRNKITNALNQDTLFTYDDNGNQRTMTDALHHTTTYDYDDNNRRIKTTYHDSSFDTIVYDEMGRTKSKTDQANKTTQFRYDELGRLTKVIDALNQETIYGYDEIGQQISQTDANLHTTRFEYDQLGRRVKRTLPGGQFETYSYDTGGDLQSKTDFNGKITTYAYDSMRHLLSKTPDASLGQPAVTFTYDATGQRETMTDASGTTVYGYDNRNRLSSKHTPFGTLSYTYNEAGSLQTTRSSNANGVSVDYSYDALNRLATVKDNNSASLNGGITNYTYDDVGNLQSYQYPNGITTSYAYNSLNRLTTMTVGTQASSLASYSYTLGAAGNRTAVTELSGRAVTYTYQDLYRLSNESIANDPHGINGSVGYGYDSVGNRLNRTSSVNSVPSQSSTYDANDRLTGDNSDNNGNTTGSSGNTYAYDFENHLTSLNNGAVTYVYDGDGNRVAKTIGGVTTNYLVDTNNPTGYAQVTDELQGGVVAKSFTYGHDLISQRSGGSVSFYQYDGHGSVRHLTDDSGIVKDAYDYDAFGNLIYGSGTTPNDYLYSGEQFDASLGFYYLRARYMNAQAGRFISMDSYEGQNADPLSLHKYAYVSGNPVNHFDPSGHEDATIAGQLVAAAGLTTIAALSLIALRQVLENVKFKTEVEIHLFPRPQPEPSPIVDFFPVPRPSPLPSPSPTPDDYVYLFHGTSMEAAQSINSVGVNEGEILKYASSRFAARSGAFYVFEGGTPLRTDPAFEEARYMAARRSDSNLQAVVVGKLPKQELIELKASGQAGSGPSGGPLPETWFMPSAFPVLNLHNAPGHWVVYPLKVN